MKYGMSLVAAVCGLLLVVAAMRQGKYAPELWKKYTGKTVDELWSEYVKTLPGR